MKFNASTAVLAPDETEKHTQINIYTSESEVWGQITGSAIFAASLEQLSGVMGPVLGSDSDRIALPALGL